MSVCYSLFSRIQISAHCNRTANKNSSESTQLDSGTYVCACSLWDNVAFRGLFLIQLLRLIFSFWFWLLRICRTWHRSSISLIMILKSLKFWLVENLQKTLRVYMAGRPGGSPALRCGVNVAVKQKQKENLCSVCHGFVFFIVYFSASLLRVFSV